VEKSAYPGDELRIQFRDLPSRSARFFGHNKESCEIKLFYCLFLYKLVNYNRKVGELSRI